jgi:hypothetical protein
MNTIDDSAGRAGSNSLRSTMTTTIAARARGRAGRALAASVLAVGVIAGMAQPAQAYTYNPTAQCDRSTGQIRVGTIIEGQTDSFRGGQAVAIQTYFKSVYGYGSFYGDARVAYATYRGWTYVGGTWTMPWANQYYSNTYVRMRIIRLGADGQWHYEPWQWVHWDKSCLAPFT